jgi:tRNA modification GTPase
MMAQVLALRVHVEAAIDFADEPLDTLGGAAVRAGLARCGRPAGAAAPRPNAAASLRDGLHAVLVGPPTPARARCSTRWPAASARSSPMSPAPPATLLRETIRIDGLELTLVDTAGLREGGDAIEREGMRRARAELQRADLALVVLDARDPEAGPPGRGGRDRAGVPAAAVDPQQGRPVADAAGIGRRRAGSLGAQRAGTGRPCTRACSPSPAQARRGGEGEFTARARHVQALRRRVPRTADAAAGELRRERWNWPPRSCALAHDALGDDHRAGQRR